jgi:hypothetical protein
VIRRIVKKFYWFVMNTLPDYLAVNVYYFCYFKKLPNLKSPETYNEKITWRKLYQRNPVFTVFSDKIAVKAEIAKLVGEQHVIETLWVGENPADIPFDTLEPPYVIKVNHSSGGTLFIRTKQDIKSAEIIKSLRKQLRFSHGHTFREWAYQGISRRVLVERMVEMPGGDVPEDYKFLVYRGRVHFIQVDCDRFKGHKLNFYERDWTPIPVSCKSLPNFKTVSAPSSLDQMIRIAEKIGQFDFARVDLYSTPKGILVGEVSFYPGSGCAPFIPEDWDYRFGEPWKIEPDSLVVQ